MSPRDNSTPAWRRYLTFWRRNVVADIDEEVRHHLDARVEELAAAGHSPADARAQALDEFGNVDDVRDRLRAIDDRMARRQSHWDWIDGWRQDLSYSARALRRTPVVTATVVVTLALGLGVNAAMFSFLDRVFTRPPAGVQNPAGISRLWLRHESLNGSVLTAQNLNYPQFQAISKAMTPATELAAYALDENMRLGRSASAPKATVVYASGNYFPLLGVRPAFGRFFTPDEDRLGSGERVVVLSYAFWHNRLHADSGVLGKQLTLNRDRYTVIGVTARDFSGIDLQAVDLWVPLATFPTPSYVDGPWWESPTVSRMIGFGRLGTDVDPRFLEQRGSQAIRDADRAMPKWKARGTTELRFGPINKARGPGDKQQELAVAVRLGGVAIIVLLIACANVGNLLLARAIRRRREIAVRLALGVSHGRLIRLLTTESVLLSLGAAAAALVASWWGGMLLRSLLLPTIRWAESPMHWRVVAFTLLVSLAAGILAGLIPALHASRPELTASLKAGARDGVVQRSRLRTSLLIVQAALSVVLLVGAALFVESLKNVRRLDLGFDVDRLVFASVAFDEGASPGKSVVGSGLSVVTERIAAQPGVEKVAVSSMRPMAGFSVITFYSGMDSLGSFQKEMPTMSAVSPTFFATTGLRITRGSDFPNLRGTAMPPVFLVNEAMAKLLWHGADPIGQCVRFVKRDNPCYFVIGVVENANREGVIESPTPQLYLPLDLMPVKGWSPEVVIVRTSPQRRGAIVGELRRLLRQTFPGGDPIVDEMSQLLEPNYRPWRLGATLFSTFGLLALVVASVGIYSTVSYGVNQRVHEFGVRVALGAHTGDVLRQVLGEGLRTVATGVALGIALAIGTGRFIASLLFGISPSSPAVMFVVAMSLLGVAAVAAFAPAWRAARVDPVTALRAD